MITSINTSERKDRKKKIIRILTLFAISFFALFFAQNVRAATSNYSVYAVSDYNGCNATNVCTYKTFYVNFWNSGNTDQRFKSTTATLKKDGTTVKTVTRTATNYFNYSNADFYVTTSGTYTLERSAELYSGGSMSWDTTTFTIYEPSQVGSVTLSSTSASLSMTGTKSATITVGHNDIVPDSVYASYGIANGNVTCSWGSWSNGTIPLTITGSYGGTDTVTVYLYASETKALIASKTISVSIGPNYTVSFNANGGSGAPSSQTKYYGKSLTLSSTTPTRSGYKFLGWSTSSSASSATYSAGGSYTSNSSATLYAVWQATYTYTISFNANGGSGVPSSISKTGTDTSVVMGDIGSTVPTRTGYTFYGWSASSSWSSKRIAYGSSSTYGGGTASDSTKATQTSSSWSYSTYCSNTGGSTSSRSLTLYAQWKANTFTVSYNANGGSGAPSSQTKTYGTSLTLSTTVPTRSGYTFAGWASSSSATSASYQAGGSYTTEATVTLYAVWKQNLTYTISFNANGGSGVPSTISKTGTDTSVVMGDIGNTIPTRTGYTFYGWSASSSWSSKRIAYGSSYGGGTASDSTKATTTSSSWTYSTYCSNTGGSTSSTSLTLYAQWKQTTYTVHYDANGGSGAPSDQTKTYGSSLTLSTTVPTRSGWTFVGWGGSSTSTSASYSAGSTYSSNSALNLYAIWKKTITLSYHANNGSGAPSSQTGTIYNSATSYTFTISSTLPSRSGGYEFAGWSTSSTATSASYNAQSSISLSANTTLYAVWETATYSISYNANGGTGAPANRTDISYGTNINLSSIKPTRTGYTFKGWSTSSTATSANYGAGDGVTVINNLSLYAVWQADSGTTATYSVSFYANGGSGAPSAQTKTQGVALTLSSTVPSRSGWTFMGWGTSSSSTSATYAAGSSYSTDANLSLYAVWKKTITLSYSANGGSGAPSSQSVTVYNSTTSYTFNISSTVPTRSDYSFQGWSTSSSALTASYTSDNSYSFSSSTTLYAVWRADSETTFTLTFDANGGDGTPADRRGIEPGTVIELSSLVPARSGYNFRGWASVKNATSPQYAPGDEVLVDSDLALFAVWQSDSDQTVTSYTIRYDANGGSGAPSNQTKTKGTAIKLSTTIPVKSGYTFLGWDTSSQASRATYAAGANYNVDGGVTLYAVWRKNSSSGSNSGSSSNSAVTKDSQTITASNKTVAYKSSSTKIGAKTSGNGKLSYSSSSSSIATVSSNGTITAKKYGSVIITITASETTVYQKASKKISVTVVPKKPTFKSFKKKGAGKLKATWKKDKSVSGYTVQMSKKKNFKKLVYHKDYSMKVTSCMLKGLKKNKNYYVRIRSYKKVGGKKLYGSWSSAVVKIW